MAGIITGAIALVTAVICLVVVDSVIAGTTFTSSALLNTIVPNIGVIAAVTTLALAGMWLFMK